jgi:hypothetical protein
MKHRKCRTVRHKIMMLFLCKVAESGFENIFLNCIWIRPNPAGSGPTTLQNTTFFFDVEKLLALLVCNSLEADLSFCCSFSDGRKILDLHIQKRFLLSTLAKFLIEELTF